ncbi:BTAD domain-containing putative transcriptional regulator [Streptomyces sp. NPDC001933]|uniref:BTAD domain-containing putative transcriptional regulator n=1 Tax=Streptomyces sp. NPDC001933 TaxID=3364626 RepID=UPI0036A68D99
MRLRRELGDRQGRLLVTRPPGYQMVPADEDDVDAAAFTRLGDSGRAALAVGDAERAAGLLAQALALWRGHPRSPMCRPGRWWRRRPRGWPSSGSTSFSPA